ncbi:MAG: sodium-dependent transporter, partial [Lachnospiraceae bacterium]|nr:sodium-dependent transporter [Candidatus Equihabitans merdae]
MEKRGFSSRIGFMVSMAAFSIGIGNMWKFPYVVGNSGGGAFLIVYLALALLFGVPCFMIELTLGRSAKTASPIIGMRKLAGKKKTPWSAIGVLGIIGIFCICSFAHTIVGGWTGGYIVKTFSGFMYGMDSAGFGAEFGAFCGSNISLIGNVVSCILLWLCLSAGVKVGVEKVCKVLLPAMLVIMVVLAVYSNTLPGASEGLIWYLKPDFSMITLDVIAAAGMQICFSVGIGMLCAFVYGSYMSEDTNLPSAALTTVILDTIIAVLSGLLIIPALFAFGIAPAAGPS